ncbi:hypothetical protein [Crassaminicella indica]|uniref:Uncharacterized protein n=1 Tax=Crassaminicella indica TaxID=2855394 RepID=A0ABX8R8S5_9CLOT|nr:hypothetical protein [Crassaminicella indica]QXM05445.1 hypothetical protein KVH43_08620 [Crassaminicella indica]
MLNELLQQLLNEVKNINEKLSSMDTEIKTINQRLKNLEQGQDRIEQKLNITHDQVFRNTEGINSIKEEIGILEAITKENTFDITKLKLIK